MTGSISRWVWLASLATLAACGGRTSTLIDDNEPSLGSSEPSGSAGTGGTVSGSSPGQTAGATSSSVGAGGPVIVPAGGASVGGAPSVGGSSGVAGGTSAGGATSVAGSPAIARSCTDFCSKVKNTPCAGTVGGVTECTSSCISAFPEDACAPIVQVALNCYQRFLSAGARSCEDATSKCEREMSAVGACEDAARPAPPPPASCTGSGSSTGVSCNLSSMCSDGTYYAVNCKQVAPGQSVCNCTATPALNAQIALNEGINQACTDAAASCGLSGPPAPAGFK